MKFSLSGEVLATGGSDKLIKIWNTVGGQNCVLFYNKSPGACAMHVTSLLYKAGTATNCMLPFISLYNIELSS